MSTEAGQLQRLRVGEEETPLRFTLEGTAPWLFVLQAAALAHLVRLLLEIRASRLTTGLARFWFLVAAAIGALELRHLYIVVGVQLLGLAAALHMIAGRPGLVSPRTRAPRRAGAFALTAVATAVFITPYVVHGSRLHGDACEYTRRSEELLEWLREEFPSGRESVENPSPFAVFAPWYLVHQIHVLGRKPVVVDPFNFPDSIEDRLEDRLKAVWWAESEE